MRNSLLILAFIVLTGQLCRLGLPWWTLPIWGATAGWLLGHSGAKAFIAGFLGGALLWITAALGPDMANDGILSTKIGQLFMGLSRWSVVAITGLLGGLLSGMGSLTGRWGREAFRSDEN